MISKYKITLIKNKIASEAKKMVGQNIDCADVAITALAKAARHYKVSLKIPIHQSGKRQLKYYYSSKYNLNAYIKKLRNHLGAVGFVDRDRITVKVKIENLEPGDLVIYDLRGQGGGRSYSGHTRIIVSKNTSEKEFKVVEGHTKAKVEINTYSYSRILYYDNWFNRLISFGKEYKAYKDGGREFNWKRIAY
ncbi:hypothetical protein [Fulvivirga sp.]|uniref:hypothetical protein n=1 Tax=Fulvivirga sp. TaxID=1931237 RepID=UPI0032EAC489